MKSQVTKFEIAVCGALAVTVVTTFGVLFHALFNITIVA
jgi:hypothetical protein